MISGFLLDIRPPQWPYRDIAGDGGLARTDGTLAVMTRASLGHTGRPRMAGPATKLIYALITVAAVLRVFSPLAGDRAELALWLAGAAWTGAFGLFAVFYGRALARPRVRDEIARPI